MIVEQKRWITYTYFNRDPRQSLSTTHLFSMVKKDLAMMVRVPFSTMIVDLRDTPFLSRWSDSTRTKVNRAEREGLTADRGNYLIPEILKLFSSTATLKGLKGYVPEDFEQLPHLESSAVYDEGVMLCSHIWLIDLEEKRAMLFVNASNYRNENDDRSLTGRAHYFLLWQDGLFLQQLGIETMDLMGYEPDSIDAGLKGVYQWKAGTHGQQETLYHYYPSWFFLLRKLRNMLTG